MPPRPGADGCGRADDASAWARGLGEARRTAGLTQGELARAAGLSIGAVRDLEQGRTRTPTAASMRAVDRALGRADATAEPDVRIRILGPLRCTVADSDVTPRGRLQARLLALAAIHVGELVSDAEYAEQLWGNEPPQDPTASLRAHAVRLRSKLGLAAMPEATRPALIRERGGYRLVDATSGGHALDVAEFASRVRPEKDATGPVHRARTLLAALALWRGFVVADIDDLVSHPRTVGWERLRREAATELAGVALNCPADVADTAASAVETVARDHVLDELLNARLVRLLTARGRPADAVRVYADTRAALADALGVDPGSELRAAYAEALNRDTAAQPTRIGRPSELPRVVGDFVGRADEIEIALAELNRGDGVPGLVAIVGMGGVGKSTLAARIAHEVRARFPDGALYLELHGASDQPLPTGRAVDLLLRRLGIALDPGDDPVTRVATLRSALASGRYVLLLDDAFDAAQVHDLLPGAGTSAAIVTARSSLAGLDGVRIVRLTELPPAAAREFIAAHPVSAQHPADSSVVSGIARACGNLPLALRLAMDHAAAAATDLPSLLARLADAETRWRVLSRGESAVRTCLEAGWTALAPAARAVLGDLAALPTGTISVEAALAAAALDDEEHLIALRELSLVEFGAGRRVGMHDLLREVVRTRAPRDPLMAGGPVGRLVAHYSDRTRRAVAEGVRYRPVPAPPDGATFSTPAPDLSGWLDREYPTLLVLADEMANERAPFDWTLIFAIALAAQARGESGRSVGIVTAAAARLGPGDRRAAAYFDFVLGRGYAFSSRPHPALASLVRVRESAAALGLGALDVWAAEGCSAVYEDLGEMELAATTCEAALLAARAAGLPDLEPGILNDVGTLMLARGDLVEAERLFRHALEANIELAHRRGQLLNTANLGAVAWWAGDDSRTAALVEPVIGPLLDVGDSRTACDAAAILAQAAVALGRRELAESAACRAVDLASRRDDARSTAEALAVAAKVESRWGVVDRAVDLLDHALVVVAPVHAPLAKLTVLLSHDTGPMRATHPARVAAAASEALSIADADGNAAAARLAKRMMNGEAGRVSNRP